MKADFSGVPPVGPAPLTVTFLEESSSTSTLSTYLWDFGDGSNLSTEQNPVHTYEGIGKYSVSLTVNNTYGEGKTITKPSYIHVQPSEYPVVKFTATPRNGTSPWTVLFFDQSELDPEVPDEMYNYIWYFDDGVTDTSNSKNPEHIYTKSGKYSPTLQIQDQKGAIFYSSHPVEINITNGTSPFSASFTAVPVSGPAPLHVSFIDQSESPMPITRYSWDFGDGSIVSTEQNPVHTYEGIGKYTVSLTITNAVGENVTKIIPAYVQTQPSDYPAVKYSVIPHNATVSQPVFFQDQSELDPKVPDEMYNYIWNFGDGTTDSSNVRNIQHQYAEPGIYSTSLQIQDQNGAKYYAHEKVEVTIMNGTSPFSASFTAVPDFGPAPLQITFIDQSVSPVPITGYSWNFGDGSDLSSEKNPTHIYLGIGKYNVTLTISNLAGDNTTTTQPESIHVEPSKYPVVKFTAIPNNVTTNEEVYFIDQSVLDPSVPDEMYNYIWIFGDNFTSGSTNERNTQHTYSTPGTYTAGLQIQDQNGAKYYAPDKVEISVGSGISSTSTITETVSENETIIPFEPVPVQKGSEKNESIVSDSGSIMSDVIVNENNIEPVTGYPLQNILENQSISADSTQNISQTTHIITTMPAPGGTIIPSGKISIPEDSDKRFTIVPDSGYYIQDVKVNGKSIGSVTEYSFKRIKTNQIISADFSSNLDPVDKYRAVFWEDRSSVLNHPNSDDINESTQKIPPSAVFSIDKPVVRVKRNVSFIANVSGPFLDPLLWDFGDNTTEKTNKNPVHRYEVPGTFKVTLTITNPYGKAVSEKTVEVFE